jgi:hypothetical protein
MNQNAVERMRELRERNADIYEEMGHVGSGRTANS